MEIETGYKKIPNFLVERKVETTPPELVPKEMKELIDWYYSKKRISAGIRSLGRINRVINW